MALDHLLRILKAELMEDVIWESSLGARVPQNEWEHFRNIAGSGSIFPHCFWQIHLGNI